MELDFDKEMDAILRRAARGERASVNSESPHPDADEISAFAENALPEKTKLFYTAHFADCDRCRKILSSVVALNGENQIEIVRAEEVKTVAADATIAPWHRRLFAVPHLAYAMGALLLVFGGLLAFTFLKSAPQTGEISSVREKPINMGGASSDGETVSTETTTSSGSNGAPTAPMSNGGGSMSNAMTTMNSNTTATASNSATARDGLSSNASSMSNAASVSNSASVQTQDAAKDESQPKPAATASAPVENSARGSNFSERRPPTAAEEETLAREKREKDDRQSDSTLADAPKPAAPKSDAAAPPPAKSSGANARSATALSAADKSKKTSRNQAERVETRRIGEKNFRRDGGVWYDASYGGQSTTNVARGSEAFVRLDSGLRSIAENLSGTVIVVWKGKAFRIQ